jgi:hypothetical protein
VDQLVVGVVGELLDRVGLLLLWRVAHWRVICYFG